MDTLLALMIGLVSGFAFAFLDHKSMRSMYRKWYKLTHKDPLPENKDWGFVYGQPFSGKLYSAVFLAGIITLIIILTGSDNLIVQLLYGVFIAVGNLVSFYAAPFVLRHGPSKFSKVKQAIDKIDQMESNMRGDRKEPAPEKKEEEPKAEEKQPPAEAADEDKDDKKDDWRSGIKGFVDDK